MKFKVGDKCKFVFDNKFEFPGTVATILDIHH